MGIDLSSFKKDTQKLPAKRKCDFCEVKVATLKSTTEDFSYKHCHLHCALRAAYLQSQNNAWKINFTVCPKENLVLQPKVDEEEVIANIRDISLDLKGVMEELGQGREFNKQVKKASRRRKSTDEENKRKRTKGEKDSFATGIFEKVNKSLNQEYRTKLLEKGIEEDNIDEEMKHLGGKITLAYELKESQKGEGAMEVEDEVKLLINGQETALTSNTNASLIRSLYKVIHFLFSFCSYHNRKLLILKF